MNVDSDVLPARKMAFPIAILDYPSVIPFVSELHQTRILQQDQRMSSTNLPILILDLPLKDLKANNTTTACPLTAFAMFMSPGNKPHKKPKQMKL